jgi:16S rRNA (cytidine1402-2'-O)-methyltransferase
MSGTLYVVATPIGNLEDVTLRALRILREVSIIAAEDTRRTGRLLQHYSISTPTTSLHEHNERQKTPSLIARLERGDTVALVSDAGTPLVSDPGQWLVAAARQRGIRVDSIPGPSVVLAAVAAAGFPGTEFAFVGFPPNRSKAREEWLRRIVAEDRLVVFFEAPHRILVTLAALQELVGADRVIGVGRELTKAHEELVVRPILELITYFSDPRGEFTVLLPPGPRDIASGEPPSPSQLASEVGDVTKNMALGRRAALRVVGERYGLAPNKLYDLIRKGKY